jgi:hypothetical protein
MKDLASAKPVVSWFADGNQRPAWVSRELSERRPRLEPIPLRLKGGVPERSNVRNARAGWFTKGRVASIYAREAYLVLSEVTNHPVCA